MRAAVLDHLRKNQGTDLYISAAAISDFAPEITEGKIRSGKPAHLDLKPLPKLIAEVTGQFHPVTIAFKIDRSPEKGARELLGQGATTVLMNTPATMGSPEGDYILMDESGTKPVKGSKDVVAHRIFSEIIPFITRK
jgi:phosphopantothenoylcysteine decarboxylase/phosphopantothenate--cysteine ligase